jgi:hypothetical protein
VVVDRVADDGPHALGRVLHDLRVVGSEREHVVHRRREELLDWNRGTADAAGYLAEVVGTHRYHQVVAAEPDHGIRARERDLVGGMVRHKAEMLAAMLSVALAEDLSDEVRHRVRVTEPFAFNRLDPTFRRAQDFVAGDRELQTR